MVDAQGNGFDASIYGIAMARITPYDTRRFVDQNCTSETDRTFLVLNRFTSECVSRTETGWCESCPSQSHPQWFGKVRFRFVTMNDSLIVRRTETRRIPTCVNIYEPNAICPHRQLTDKHLRLTCWSITRYDRNRVASVRRQMVRHFGSQMTNTLDTETVLQADAMC
jgi:hypothetical protein